MSGFVSGSESCSMAWKIAGWRRGVVGSGVGVEFQEYLEGEREEEREVKGCKRIPFFLPFSFFLLPAPAIWLQSGARHSGS